MSTAIPIKINASGELTLERCRCSSDMSDASIANATAAVLQAVPATAEGNKTSYGQILKSSALVGGSQVANVGISIVRTKAMAMLLGPAGFGLFGLFGSVQNLTQNIAGMGINSSGVRQIAEAVGTGDKQRVAQTAAVLRRTAIILGLFGAALLTLFCRPISRLTFGTPERASAVALLSIAVFFSSVSGGQAALIQGVRRIADLAKMNVLGTLLGLCSAVPLVYFFRQQGVVPSLVAVAGMGILISSWYSRKIEVGATTVTLSQVWQEAWSLLQLGSVFMASGLMVMGVAYAVRIIILRQLGFEATGLYQSAWTLGGLYVGFILQAMGADFYPRLTASADNNVACNRLVNEQILAGLLLAGPGVVATISVAPLVVSWFYSAKFGPAVSVLRWICLGVALQVVTWPMGYIIVAKARKGLFFFAEFAWTAVAIALAWACITRFGLDGAGIAFFLSYVFHGLLIYAIVRKLSGFHWFTPMAKPGLVFFLSITAVFFGFFMLPQALATAIGLLITALSAAYSIRVLVSLVSLNQIPASIKVLITKVGIPSRMVEWFTARTATNPVGH